MPALNDDFARTRHAFEIWRANQKGRTRIPLELWERAVSSLTHHPITRVARELRIDPAELRKRCQASSPPPVPVISPAPQFLELPANLHDENSSQHKTQVAPCQFTTTALRLVVERADGNRLTLHLPAASCFGQDLGMSMDFSGAEHRRPG